MNSHWNANDQEEMMDGKIGGAGDDKGRQCESNVCAMHGLNLKATCRGTVVKN